MEKEEISPAVRTEKFSHRPPSLTIRFPHSSDWQGFQTLPSLGEGVEQARCSHSRSVNLGDPFGEHGEYQPPQKYSGGGEESKTYWLLEENKRDHPNVFGVEEVS